MDCPATVKDVEARWGPVEPNQTERVQTWLQDAWLDAQSVHSLTERLAAERAAGTDGAVGLLEQQVIRVLCAAVIRVLKNPKSLWRFSVDDGSMDLDRSISSGEVYLSAEERAKLAPVVNAGTLPGMYSLPMGVPYWGE